MPIFHGAVPLLTAVRETSGLSALNRASFAITQLSTSTGRAHRVSFLANTRNAKKLSAANSRDQSGPFPTLAPARRPGQSAHGACPHAVRHAARVWRSGAPFSWG